MNMYNLWVETFQAHLNRMKLIIEATTGCDPIPMRTFCKFAYSQTSRTTIQNVQRMKFLMETSWISSNEHEHLSQINPRKLGDNSAPFCDSADNSNPEVIDDDDIFADVE